MTNLYSEAHEIQPLTVDISPRSIRHSLLLDESKHWYSPKHGKLKLQITSLHFHGTI